MKNLTLLSLVAATLLFTACGEKTKEAASDAANKVTEAVKADTTSAVEATKKAAAEAAEAAQAKAAEVKAAAEAKATAAAEALKERAAATTTAAKEMATSAVDSVKDAAAATTEAASEAVDSAKAAVADNTAGKAAFAKCVGCHGADGKTKALGKSAVIAGEPAADLESKLAAYKVGTRNVAGMGMLMKGQVSSMDEATIKAVAAYISSL